MYKCRTKNTYNIYKKKIYKGICKYLKLLNTSCALFIFSQDLSFIKILNITFHKYMMKNNDFELNGKM
jgi:hypothetical protein